MPPSNGPASTTDSSLSEDRERSTDNAKAHSQSIHVPCFPRTEKTNPRLFRESQRTALLWASPSPAQQTRTKEHKEKVSGAVGTYDNDE